MATDTLELVKALVAIDSVNPSLVVGGAGEREIAEFVVGWARGCGLDAEVLEQTPGRPSVVARGRGSGGGRTLLLCGHYDTVTVEGMADPHTARPEELVGLVRDAAATVLGTPPPIARAGYWTDAAFIAAAGIPTIVFGPSGEGAPAAEEWVSVSATDAVAEILIEVAERVCG